MPSVRKSEKHSIWAHGGSLSRLLFIAVLVYLPASVRATTTSTTTSTTVTWSSSTDPNVVGYTLYYGTQSRSYTSSIIVSTNQAAVTNLTPGVTYYFAAKSDGANGLQSDYSTEATFAAYTAAPATRLNFRTVSPTNTDQFTYSLDPSSPSAASVNPSNGVVSWTPDYTYANTTNAIAVTVNDVTTPSASRLMTFLVSVGDYLVMSMPSVAAQSGQNASLPLHLASSDGVTNISFTLAWPGQSFKSATLSLDPSIAGSTFHHNPNSVTIQVWTANGAAITTNSPFATVNFSVASGLTSGFVPVPVSSVTANKSAGTSFSYVTTPPGEVVVVGSAPLLRPSVGNGTRNLTLYANPGTNYELDCATSLAKPIQWQAVQNYSPTAVQQTIALDPSAPVIFYRLKQL